MKKWILFCMFAVISSNIIVCQPVKAGWRVETPSWPEFGVGVVLTVLGAGGLVITSRSCTRPLRDKDLPTCNKFGDALGALIGMAFTYFGFGNGIPALAGESSVPELPAITLEEMQQIGLSPRERRTLRRAYTKINGALEQAQATFARLKGDFGGNTEAMQQHLFAELSATQKPLLPAELDVLNRVLSSGCTP